MLGPWGFWSVFVLHPSGFRWEFREFLQVLNEKNVQIMCDSPYLDLLDFLFCGSANEDQQYFFSAKRIWCLTKLLMIF